MHGPACLPTKGTGHGWAVGQQMAMTLYYIYPRSPSLLCQSHIAYYGYDSSEWPHSFLPTKRHSSKRAKREGESERRSRESHLESVDNIRWRRAAS